MSDGQRRRRLRNSQRSRSLLDALTTADRLLYVAKREGKNRAHIATMGELKNEDTKTPPA